ncbi:hypothetical protein B4U80_00205 [Leptotrombidium deliense]|uniref:RRM domain-containing protein n=1 Tax=Leptotrombidium deliense TaxID=299467 RepID=A0A443SK86_9ACAR|nr:hypothetical protein B4U80_00205 [Leptotrombidium deliense]
MVFECYEVETALVLPVLLASGDQQREDKTSDGNEDHDENGSVFSSPLKSESVITTVQLTSSDAISMDTSSDRKNTTDDLSLVVHVDDTQSEIDADMDLSAVSSNANDSKKYSNSKKDEDSGAMQSNGKSSAQLDQSTNESKELVSDEKNAMNTSNASTKDSSAKSASKESEKSSSKTKRFVEVIQMRLKVCLPLKQRVLRSQSLIILCLFYLTAQSHPPTNHPNQVHQPMRIASVIDFIRVRNDYNYPFITEKKSTVSTRNVWVSGLSQNTRANDLQTLFSKCGKVVSAKIITNTRIPGSRCYGFITMETAEQAEKCIRNLNKTELNGRTIIVEKVSVV